MYRLAILALLGACTALAAGAPPASAAKPDAELHIVAPDGMEFRSIGLNPAAFSGSRDFKVPAGTYIVVQAPPVATLQIDCSDGEPFTHVLADGDDVTCTYQP